MTIEETILLYDKVMENRNHDTGKAAWGTLAIYLYEAVRKVAIGDDREMLRYILNSLELFIPTQPGDSFYFGD